jgi:hypothetical protein
MRVEVVTQAIGQILADQANTNTAELPDADVTSGGADAGA